eukprot:m.201722 g.201722  ORF g.201722 m.201722 type:complete len:322 (+) comp10682_c0_seq10:1516-2481(+)
MKHLVDCGLLQSMLAGQGLDLPRLCVIVVVAQHVRELVVGDGDALASLGIAQLAVGRQRPLNVGRRVATSEHKLVIETNLQVCDGANGGTLHHDKGLWPALTVAAVHAKLAAATRRAKAIKALIRSHVLNVTKGVDVREVGDERSWVDVFQKPVKRLALQALAQVEHFVERANVNLGIAERLAHDDSILVHPDGRGAQLVLRKMISGHGPGMTALAKDVIDARAGRALELPAALPDAKGKFEVFRAPETKVLVVAANLPKVFAVDCKEATSVGRRRGKVDGRLALGAVGRLQLNRVLDQGPEKAQRAADAGASCLKRLRVG